MASSKFKNLFVKHYGLFISSSKNKTKSLVLEHCSPFVPEDYELRPKEKIKLLDQFLKFVHKARKALKELKIIHSDIKMDNVMYCNEKIKLTDFGGGVLISWKQNGRPGHSLRKICGKFDTFADDFAFGFLILEMLYKLDGKKMERNPRFMWSHDKAYSKKCNSKRRQKLLYEKLLKIVWQTIEETKILPTQFKHDSLLFENYIIDEYLSPEIVGLNDIDE